MNRYWLLMLLLGCAVDCRVADAQDALTCVAFQQSNPISRAESVAELVSDLIVYCSGGTPASSGAAIPAYDITLTFNANVTSRLIGSDGQSTEALLLIDGPSPGSQFPCEQPTGVCQSVGNGTGGGYYGGDSATNRNVFQGVRGTGTTTLTWKSIPFDPPGTGQYRTFQFTNLRLDATSPAAVAAGLGTTSISLTGTAGASATIPVVNDALPLSLVSPSLTAVVRDAGNTTDSSSGVTVTVAAAATMTPVATLRFTEGFAGADRARTAATFVDVDTSPPPVDQNSGFPYGTESGFYNSTFGTYGNRGNLATAGLADSGTRYMAVIDQIPVGYNVYVDVYSATTATGATARLINAGPSGD